MGNNKARSLEFTLAIGCPLQCKYCPQDKLLEKYKEHSCKRMSFGTFMRVLSQIMPGGGGLYQEWWNHGASLHEIGIADYPKDYVDLSDENLAERKWLL